MGFPVDLHTRGFLIQLQPDVDFGEGNRVAEGYQLARLLCSHDACKPSSTGGVHKAILLQLLGEGTLLAQSFEPAQILVRSAHTHRVTEGRLIVQIGFKSRCVTSMQRLLLGISY